ncbi:channel-forming protein ArfA/OmpATb [Mycolicibacterium septicum]|jgi:peptidoglycan-binding protein ArfA|uniref:channel-forming protein ArfA/OmpATb n=1 Tax=Mycolicibacterium septicum TaxID=98668 RepID=UPI001AF372ED|nr:OmpA family protein [Mycolicibacterium septicum]QRY51648.1 OmpA family protein [Mycolicibacterium septicum]
MSGSDESRTITGWQTASKLYRRPPGLGWLLALAAVPLLLGLIGWGGLDHSNKNADVTLPDVNPTATLTAPDVNAPDVNAPNVNLPNLSFAPLSITRNGNDFTLTGDLPDAAAKTSLLDWLRGKFGADVNLIDNLNLRPGVSTPDVSALGKVFDASADIPDFNFSIDGDTLTLTGTAPSAQVRDAVEAAAKAAWPNIKLVNNIQIAAAPAAPAPPAPGAPGAPGGTPGPCAVLQGDVSALLKTPINFSTDGFAVAPSSQQLLSQVADKLKSCEGAKVAVTGYTDSSGNDAINIPLSGNRAKAVADYLVSQGLAADHVTSSGAGSANPIASNDTPEGKAQNRRVEITVN